MEENDKRKTIINAMLEVKSYPLISDEEIVIEKRTKLPLSKLANLGVAFEPLVSIFQSITSNGVATSGLYRVTIPNGISGHLAQFQDGSGFLGTVVQDKVGIVGQARLNPLVCNPTMLFMAVALMNIDKKLDRIQETQIEILEFLKQKEESKLKGNLNVLSDILNNYKYNWNNEKYKTNKHILVQEIMRDAEQSIIFYREQTNSKINKQSFLHSDQDVKNQLKRVQSEFKDYQLALYLFSFSSFLEVMLLENFESGYLDSIARKIEDYSSQYQEFHTKCYEQIENYSKSSIHSNLLGGLAGINKLAGNALSRVSIASKFQIDETLIKTGNRIGGFNSRMTEQNMGRFAYNEISCISPFIENINAVNRLYNQQMELVFDQESLYLSLSETEG